MQIRARDIEVFFNHAVVHQKTIGYSVTFRFCLFAMKVSQQTSTQNQSKNVIMHALPLCECHKDLAYSALVSMSRLLTSFASVVIVTGAVISATQLFYTSGDLLWSSIIRLRKRVDIFHFSKLADT